MIDRKDVEDWEKLPLISDVLTSPIFGAWLYYREENMRESIKKQAKSEEKMKILGLVNTSLNELRECANDSSYYFDSDNYDLVMTAFDWLEKLRK